MSDDTPVRPVFLLQGNAEIKHLNVRKEGPEDGDKILMVDLKLEVLRVDLRFCRFFDDALLSFFWNPDLAMTARNSRLQPVGFVHEIKAADAFIGGLHFAGAQVKRITLLPMDGGVLTVGCSVTLTQPTADEVAVLAKAVQDVVGVIVEAQPDLFDGDAGAKAAGKKPKARKGATAGQKAAAAALQAMALADGTSVEVLVNTGTPLGAAIGAELTKATAEGDAALDPLLADASELVRKDNRASISHVQRHLNVGYNRASRLLETLERHGVVSAMDAKGGRTVAKPRGDREAAPKLRTDVAWPFPGQVSEGSPAAALNNAMTALEAAALAKDESDAASGAPA